MAAFTRKQYAGAASPTTTTSLLTDVGTSVTIASTTGWPSIADLPFYIAIEPGSANEEKCLATISGNTLTLVRAQDDTTASQHPIGSSVYPVFTANDADEANEIVSKLTTKGDLLVTDGNGLYRLGVGTDGFFLKANSSASVGLEWASIPTINSLDDVGDVSISDIEDGDILLYDSSASAWVNETIHFLTVSDTAPTDEVKEGDLWYNSLELELYIRYSSAWEQVTITPEFPTVEELDNVYVDNAATNDVLAFDGNDWYNASINNLIGGTLNAATAETLETARIISLSGDVSGSVSFDGSQNVTIAAEVQPNSISLGTDTTGNYMSGISAGTGISVSHTPGEGSTGTVSINATLDNLSDVTAPSPSSGDFLKWNGTAWTNDEINLGADTAGIYVADVIAGTGVTIANSGSESASPTISTGQAVGTSASVTFANVTSDVVGDVTGNADTATTLLTSRIIELSGDVSGSASFNGGSNINISTTVNTSSVAIGELYGVNITNPEEFQTLEYNGTSWVNQYASVVSYVRNAEATTLTTGTPVYLFGGTGDHATVKRADNSSDATSSKTVGLVGVNITASQNGPVITRGYVDGVDLSMYNPGDVLWLGKNGQVTTTKPSAPDHLVFIGVVVRATNNGIVYVATQNGYELEELHDVKISGLSGGQFLRYNSASTVWTNDTIDLGTDTAGDYVQSLVAGTGVTLSNNSGESSTPTISIGQAVGTSASVTFANIDATGNLTVGGNLTVNGTTTTLNTETLAVEDNIIVLNSGISGSPTIDAGIEVERGSATNVSITWNEFSDSWMLTNDGAVFYDIVTKGNVIDDLNGVKLTDLSAGQFLSYDGADWINNTINLGTDTEGNYMSDLTQGTGVTITHTPSEGSNATIAIGQAVETTSEVQFASVKLDRAIETATVSASAAGGTLNFDYKTNSSLYYTSSASATWTMNLRGDGSTTFESMVAVGDTVTVSFLVTQGASGASYYPTALSIDGTSVTPKWVNGSAPTSGNANSVDVYTYTVVKTAATPTYTVFASATRFA